MTFAIGIRYLTGVAAAAHPTNRGIPEWPPHPGRVFMALVSAHFETGGDKKEHDALLWLERQPPPSIRATSCQTREAPGCFVPVNDVTSGLRLLPESRPRQSRQFPAAIPNGDTVYLIWDEAPESETGTAIASLCGKVTYVGHSSTLVQIWLEDEPIEPTLVPLNGVPSRFRLRIPGSGSLSVMEARYKAGQRPAGLRWVGYGDPPTRPKPEAPGTVFTSELVVLRKVEGPPINLVTTDRVCQVLRDTLMSRCSVQPPPEWISGHSKNGGRSDKNHMAVFPLADVGQPYADGHIMGLAIAIPREFGPEAQAMCWTGVLYDESGMAREFELRLGKLGLWTVRIEESSDSERPLALRDGTWVGNEPAMCWSTVTPIALDHHPKGADRFEKMEKEISEACVRIGLPRPDSVEVSQVSPFAGVPVSRDFPALHRKSDNGSIVHTHASMIFHEPVRGPVLVGAGRYRGYGLCRPLLGMGTQE